MPEMTQWRDRYPEDCGTNPKPLLRKGSSNVEVLLGNGKSLARVREHTLSRHTPALLWGSPQRVWWPQGRRYTTASWDGMGCCQRHGRKTKGQSRQGYWLEAG